MDNVRTSTFELRDESSTNLPRLVCPAAKETGRNKGLIAFGKIYEYIETESRCAWVFCSRDSHVSQVSTDGCGCSVLDMGTGFSFTVYGPVIHKSNIFVLTGANYVKSSSVLISISMCPLHLGIRQLAYRCEDTPAS